MSISPILLEFPDSFETERLLVRALRKGDGPAMNEAVLESFDELHPWVPWAQGRPSLAESESRARESAAEWILRTDLAVLLFRKEDGVLVGGSGLHRADWEARRFEVGYWCRTKYAGQGYITEAVKGLVDFAFTRLNAWRIELRCDAENARSIRTAGLSGFKLEATLRDNAIGPAGSHRSTCVFVRFRGE